MGAEKVIPEIKCELRTRARGDRVFRGIAVLAVISFFVGFVLLTAPSGKNDTKRSLDFTEFYVAGQMVCEGMGGRLYDLGLQAEKQSPVAPIHAFYLRPPFEAILFIPLTFVAYRTAYAIWVLVSVGLLAGACFLIVRITGVAEAVSQYTRGMIVDFGLLLVIFLTFGPSFNCLLIGQDTMLLLMVYTLVFIALKSRRDLAAGGLLACGLFKFHLVVPFVIIFLIRRRWRFLTGFAAVGGLLMLISVLVSGWGVFNSYAGMFLNSKYRFLMGFEPQYAANIRGLVYLLARERVPVIVSFALVVSLSVVLLWIVARRWENEDCDLSFSAGLLGTILTGYHLFIYDLTLLLLAIAITCGELARRRTLLGQRSLAGILIIFFVPPLHYLLTVEHMYALMSIPVAVLLGINLREAEKSNVLLPREVESV